jgi:hypothetical protein
MIEMSLEFWNREWWAGKIKAEWRFFVMSGAGVQNAELSSTEIRETLYWVCSYLSSVCKLQVCVSYSNANIEHKILTSEIREKL